jgi:very-short-patch-repair endonuclease
VGLPTSCPKCKKKRVTEANSLLLNYPDIAKEYDIDRNMFPLDWLSYASNRNIYWKCKHGHQWGATCNERVLKQNGCPFCSGRKPTDETRLSTRFPTLLKEWDYENNKVSPEDISYGSGYKAHWICGKGHRWVAAVCDRTHQRGHRGGNNCARCDNSKSSILQDHIYDRIKAIFQDTEHRKTFDGIEVDIYIPSIKVAVEVDGRWWHRDKFIKDMGKHNLMKSKGIRLLNFREKGLPKINGDTLFYSYITDYDILSTPLICKILEIAKLPT